MTDFIKETQNAVPGAIRLETARMILRDHRLEDLESHHEMLSDPGGDVLSAGHYDSQPGRIPTGFGEKTPVRAVTAQPRREYFLRMEEKGTGELIGEIWLYGYGGDTGGKAGSRRVFQQEKVLGQGIYVRGVCGGAAFRI